MSQSKTLTPEDLLMLWNKYKAWNNANPVIEEVVTVKGDIVHKKTPSPLLRQGFESWVFNKIGFGIGHYLEVRQGYEQFLEVVTHIRNEWQDNNVKYTLAGVYKAPNLVARINGFKENVEETGSKEVTIKVSYDKGDSDKTE